MKLGFIGLGAMGRPMALQLLSAGHQLALWARRPESLRPLLDQGARACTSPAEVAGRAEIVFTMVTTSDDVAAIALGPDGLIHGAPPGSIHVDMSTIAPQVARRIAGRLAEMDIAMLDAPVSGGVAAAREATLAIMVGGEAGTLSRVRPLLETLGKTIVHVGGHGAGQVAKACNQMVMVASIEACAEAMRLAAASGVDPERVRVAMEHNVFKFGPTIIPVTISLGVATSSDPSIETPDHLMMRADEWLYAAKQNGRNRVEHQEQ